MSGFISNQARRNFLALAAALGATMVGNGGETVAAALSALQLADYAALRAYPGPRKAVYVTGYLVAAAPVGVSGLFIRDDLDTVTPDNGGTVIVAANGKRWKRTLDDTVSVEWFGATGTGNDTAAIQAALDFAAPRRLWVIGQGKNYSVATIKPSSGQRAKSLYLQSVGPLAGGAVSFQPVIEINGSVALKTDMMFVDVKANGRRDLFPNVDMSLGEDGGMHAWRVVGDAAGGVTNILWRDCDGINAATAGLAIHSVNPASGAGGATFPIKNLRWIGGNLTGNREHGWFADAFDGLTIDGADCRYNGTDLNTVDPLTHGNRGARSGGTLFGGGFDVESYGPALVGSLWRNLTLRNLDCRACAMPAQMYNPIATNVGGYVPHTGIIIEGCRFDAGTAAGADRAASTSYSFNALGNLIGSAYPYQGMILKGNLFAGQAPRFNGVNGLTVTGGYIDVAGGVRAHVYNCKNWDVSANASTLGVDLVPSPVLTLTKYQGSTASAVTALTLVNTISLAGGLVQLDFTFQTTGAAAVDGDLVYQVHSPLVGMRIIHAWGSSRSNGTLKANASAFAVVAVDTVNIAISTASGTTLYNAVSLILSP